MYFVVPNSFSLFFLNWNLQSGSSFTVADPDILPRSSDIQQTRKLAKVCNVAEDILFERLLRKAKHQFPGNENTKWQMTQKLIDTWQGLKA